MKWTGNIRKMRSKLEEEVVYTLPLYDILEPSDEVPISEMVGENVSIHFDGYIHCTVSGKQIKKTYGDGMSYDAFMSSPLASPSIIRPELSRIHEGVALRDEEWERKHHLAPHIVYLSLTSGIKVGVTRDTNIPSRWIDQGAVEAILLAETPYRQLAGLIEVTLKEHVADKTNWRHMLTNTLSNDRSLLEAKDDLLEELPEAYHDFISDNDEITQINYPVLHYPAKVTSMKLDKLPEISGKLEGIKGQYLIFDGGKVINMRSHAGYCVSIEV